VSAPRVTGSFVALITPMNDDYSVDHGGFKELIDFQRVNGTSALLIMGSSGEVSMLTSEERHTIVERTVGAKDDDLQIWYGCTGATTEATIDYVQQAAAAGADGAILAAPSYIAASTDNIVQFFLDVADVSPIPIGIYNNPPRVMTDLHPEDIVKIAAHPMVTVLKESTARVGQVAEVARAGIDAAMMCCCNPHLGLIVPTMSLGGHGTANVSGNMIPQEMAQISTPWSDFDTVKTFQETYTRILPMLEFAYCAVNPVPAKSFLGAVGMPAGPMRRPLTLLDPDRLAAGLGAARDLGLDEKYGYQISSA